MPKPRKPIKTHFRKPPGLSEGAWARKLLPDKLIPILRKQGEMRFRRSNQKFRFIHTTKTSWSGTEEIISLDRFEPNKHAWVAIVQRIITKTF